MICIKGLIADILNDCINFFVFIFIQAVARGLKDPSFGVIQNHFAISGNLGEVAAKVHYCKVNCFRATYLILIIKFSGYQISINASA